MRDKCVRKNEVHHFFARDQEEGERSEDDNLGSEK